MSIWETVCLGDICDTISTTYKGQDENVVLINTSDVFDGEITNHIPVPNQNLRGQFKKTFCKNDILYSEIRPANRRFAFVDLEDTSCYIASTKLMVIRPHLDRVRPRFLYAFLASETVIRELQHLAESRSGTFPQITFGTEIAPMLMHLPNLELQDRVTGILDSISKKITTNKKINDNLEQQAASYFYRLFIENASTEWREGTISDLGTVVGGSTPSKAKPEYYTDHGIAWITPKDLSLNKSKFISRGENDITELGLKNSSAVIMPEGTVLFSSRAPIGYIAIAASQVCTNQGFKSVVPASNIGTAFVYYFLKYNLPTIEGMASGSTFKEISGSTMKSVPAIIPDNASLAQFDDFCRPIFDQQRTLEAQNQFLSSLRDTLLPKLMSGEIDLSEIRI